MSDAVQPIPMLLWCPSCGGRHIDEGEFATKVHHTHSCQACGLTWRPAVIPTVGVQFLPGFKDKKTNRHELKTYPKPFEATWAGVKLHEIRVNDRPFNVGDALILREYRDPSIYTSDPGYTGRYIAATISYITPGGDWGMPDDLCAMSIRIQETGTNFALCEW